MFKPTPRRKREHEQHIKYILDTAESIFAEQGFFRTTMRKIALKAEFALGTIYSYFGSKRQLYEKVIETKVHELVDLVTKEMTDVPSVQKKIEKFIHTKMSFLNENLAFLRLYFAETNVPRLDTKQILPRKIRDKYSLMINNLAGVIQRGIQQGLFKPMDAKRIAKALDDFTNAFAISWLHSEERFPIEKDTHIVTELFLNGISIRQALT